MGKMLKLGGRKHLGEERWRAALEIFDEIYCACIYREDTWDVSDDRVHIIELKKNMINYLLTGVIIKTRFHRSLFVVNWLLIAMIRLFNIDWLRQIRNCDADFALCSYGDYDRSDLVYLLARPVVKCRTVRSYKETRLKYNFLEKETFKRIDRLSFYDIELQRFLEKKYGKDFFDNKKILLGWDENALPDCILKGIRYKEKLSAQTGKKHIVILSFRVDSTKGRERDEARYYYIDTIEQLIRAGLVVHLHCAKYINGPDGENKYEELKKKYPDDFFMEAPLEMKRDSSREEWIRSCEVLSRYDFGLLHNLEMDSSVSQFDKINIPHRYFAYEAAHVAPIIGRGTNVVLEKLFAEQKCGIIYDNLEELRDVDMEDVSFVNPRYENYLTTIVSM